jgi:hypothetical protein
VGDPNHPSRIEVSGDKPKQRGGRKDDEEVREIIVPVRLSNVKGGKDLRQN